MRIQTKQVNDRPYLYSQTTIPEKLEYNKDLQIIFVDFQNAYDSIDRTSISIYQEK